MKNRQREARGLAGAGLGGAQEVTAGDALIDDKNVPPMVMRGREMTGWLRVDPAALRTATQLKKWVARGVGFARSLPAKKK